MKHKCSVNGCPEKGIYFAGDGMTRPFCKQHRHVIAGLYRDWRGEAQEGWRGHDGRKVGKPREWDGRDRAAIERYMLDLSLLPDRADDWTAWDQQRWDRRHA